MTAKLTGLRQECLDPSVGSQRLSCCPGSDSAAPNTPSECREPREPGARSPGHRATSPISGSLPCDGTLDREANGHPEEVSTSSRVLMRKKNSGVETVRIPAHCRCRTKNKHGKFLKFCLKTHTAHTKTVTTKPK